MTDFSNQSGYRPKFLNLFKIRMPITAVVSILHRLSGILIFILMPFVIYGLGLSLKSADGFQVVQDYFDSMLFKLVLFIILSALFYHLIAGIRFLLMDLDIGHQLNAARNSSWWVMIVAVFILAGLVTNMGIL